MIYLDQPLFLVGLISIPALIGIYLWRRRTHKVMVSSLILWQNLTPVRQGGSRLHKLRTSLLFFIELMILFLIVLASAQPMLSTTQMTHPLTIILDDSVSMLARDQGDSPQKRGLEQIDALLRSNRYLPVRFILAGLTPKVYPRAADPVKEWMHMLNQWRCTDPHADLAKALETALALRERDAFILVVSDQAPPSELLPGNLQWRAVGKPLANMGFVNAARTRNDEQDHCLLEIVNFGDHQMDTVLQIGDRQKKLRFEARETKRMKFELPSETSLLTAFISDDSLAADNRVWLYPPFKPQCRVQVAIRHPEMRSNLESALRATRRALTVADRAMLLFTDQGSAASVQPDSQNRWVVHMPILDKGMAYQGPFVTDYTHSLMQGIAWEGVIWDAGQSDPLPGEPVLSAGDTALLTDRAQPSGRHAIYMRIHPERSDLFRTPAWPSLIWNLLQWRIDHLPGLKNVNVRAGANIPFIPADGVDQIRVTTPSGDRSRIMVQQGVAHIQVRQTGCYLIEAGNRQTDLAVNLLAARESDLTQQRTGQWGAWDEKAKANQHSRPLAWLLLVLALIGLGVHLMAAKGLMFKG